MSEAEQSRGTEEPQQDSREGDSGRSDAKGRLLAGRYRLDGVLGRGGMGTVWRAVDEMLGRTVAVKELRFPGSIDEDEKRRLITRTLREAKAIARIRNNGAVTVFDVVEEDDRPWIVMELIEGKSLADVIREDGTLTPKRAAEVGLAILDVLRQAHSEGILHRDVKPSNVLIAEDGRVVLTDFGIAQVEGDPSVTSTGMLVGAPSYISPERARGRKPGPAADLWSLGGLLYAAVEGTPPYDRGSAIATLTAVMTEQFDPPKHAGRLEEVIRGLLVKEPEDRIDEAGARVLLNRVIDEPERPAAAEEKPTEVTRAVPVVTLPGSDRTKSDRPRSERAKGGRPSWLTKPGAAGTESGDPEKPAGTTARPAGRRPAAAFLSAAAAATAAAARRTPGTPSTAAGGPAVPRAPLSDVISRRTMVIVAIVVVLALIGIVLAFTLGGDDSDGAAPAGNGGAKPSSGVSASASHRHVAGGPGPSGSATPGTGKPTAGTQGTSPSHPQTVTTTAPASSTGSPRPGGSTLPAGYTTVRDGDFDYTIGLPKGFHRTGTAGQNSGHIYSADGGFPRVQIDFTHTPSKDALAAWRQEEPAVRGSSSDYRLISLEKVDYRGYPTVADWQFEREQNDTRVRVLDRGFRIDGSHGFSIMITCKASAWDGSECSAIRDTAFATFDPSL